MLPIRLMPLCHARKRFAMDLPRDGMLIATRLRWHRLAQHIRRCRLLTLYARCRYAAAPLKSRVDAAALIRAIVAAMPMPLLRLPLISAMLYVCYADITPGALLTRICRSALRCALQQRERPRRDYYIRKHVDRRRVVVCFTLTMRRLHIVFSRLTLRIAAERSRRRFRRA